MSPSGCLSAFSHSGFSAGFCPSSCAPQVRKGHLIMSQIIHITLDLQPLIRAGFSSQVAHEYIPHSLNLWLLSLWWPGTIIPWTSIIASLWVSCLQTHSKMPSSKSAIWLLPNMESLTASTFCLQVSEEEPSSSGSNNIPIISYDTYSISTEPHPRRLSLLPGALSVLLLPYRVPFPFFSQRRLSVGSGRPSWRSTAPRVLGIHPMLVQARLTLNNSDFNGLCINCLVLKKYLLWAHFIAIFLSSSEADHVFGPVSVGEQSVNLMTMMLLGHHLCEKQTNKKNVCLDLHRRQGLMIKVSLPSPILHICQFILSPRKPSEVRLLLPSLKRGC